MLDCCSNKNKNKCIRKDGKEFKLPRKFSKKDCLTKKIKGFSMKSSCVPYKYCKKSLKGGTRKKVNLTDKNLHGKELKTCSLKPLTGYYRDGKCKKINSDFGKHTVCSKITAEFLKFSKERNNDLSSVVKPGENWCLCEDRWLEAYLEGKAPPIIKEATNQKINRQIKKLLSNNKKVNLI